MTGPEGLAAVLEGSQTGPSGLDHETRDAMTIRPEDAGRRDPRPEKHSELEWPFCGDEYPPLRGTLSTIVCTKAPHPAGEGHLNEASGLGWRDRGTARLPRGPECRRQVLIAETPDRRIRRR